MSKILVTGGCGYIGSHTIVDLSKKGFDVISVDNLSRSDGSALRGIKDIIGKEIENYKIDLCDLNLLRQVFNKNRDIVGIIHFAAYKSVPESIEIPLDYYSNNVNSLLNLLFCCKEFNIKHFVFSSSCSVYGNLDTFPVSEDTPMGYVECPYAYSKQVGEQILKDFSKVSKTNCIALRYFNPVGAHETYKIGEIPSGVPGNLFPIIMEVAHNKRKQLIVHGQDYDTRDGSCIRDFVHVMDIAEAHTKAIRYITSKQHISELEVINLGTGNGISIFEVLDCFEKTIGFKLNHKVGARRDGDIAMIFANNEKAKRLLGWKPKRSLSDMIESAYNWDKRLN